MAENRVDLFTTDGHVLLFEDVAIATFFDTAMAELFAHTLNIGFDSDDEQRVLKL
jgi:hypothetical protein